jgi:retron-type reverse transcriptase
VLYDKVWRRDVLEEAVRRVIANRGSAGVDGQTIGQLKAYGVSKFIGELQAQLREKRYRPNRVRRCYIPKPDGRERPLGIPAVNS